MKNENIPADVKSKSLKEARDEINDILTKLESKEVDLAGSLDDYKRLIQLNKHIDLLFLFPLYAIHLNYHLFQDINYF